MRGRKTKVKCITTGEVFNSLGDACLKYNIRYSKLWSNLNNIIHFAGTTEDGEPLQWEYHYDDIDWMVK